MAEEHLDTMPEEVSSGSWRRGWASIGAVLATILLVGLVVLVGVYNEHRDEALRWERHTYDVNLLTRSVDATVARSEAALGLYVIGTTKSSDSAIMYYNQWQLAGQQIDQLRQLVANDPAQVRRVNALKVLFQRRGQELSLAATATASNFTSYGAGYYFSAEKSKTGENLRAQLESIAATERDSLRRRMAETQMFADEADLLTQVLGALGIVIGLAAIIFGLAAYQAIRERLIARREADDEANRAMALEQAVEQRTRELIDANDRLQAEVAERAAAEARLRQVQKMEAVGQLTGGIAHDFNNMLAVVVGGLDLARRKLSGPRREVEFHLENALEGATRAAQLTRRLLAFARSEPLLPEPVEPVELVEGMLDLIDRSIGERITVQTRFTAEPWHVWVDAHQLENAMVNLAVNARDAMDGQGQLVIAIENAQLSDDEVGTLQSGEYVRISVSDTGVGISEEHLERVFEPFFTTKPVGKGTGLGLSQIFAFARQSGGDVAIQSKVGVGTTVSLYLPRSLAAGVELAKRTRLSDTEIAEAPLQYGSGAQILVVEDDPRVSRSTVGALEELGYAAISCASGADALKILEQGEPIDLIISDVMMPEMTGPELVRIVSRTYPGIGVLLVTGFVGEAGESEELSSYDILRKPFTVAVLAAAVANVLKKRVSGLPPAPTSAAAE